MLKLCKNTLISISIALLSALSFAEYKYEFDEMDLEMIKSIDENLDKLDSLDVSDGIEKSEAQVILDSFYYTLLADGCGAPGELEDIGTSWKAPTFSGFSANPDSPIYIDKKSGSISRNGKLLVEYPKDMEFIFPVAYDKYKALQGSNNNAKPNK